MCEDEFPESVVDILRAGVVEAHVEFDEQAHHKVEVEVWDESVGVDVADAACIVGDVENELPETYTLAENLIASQEAGAGHCDSVFKYSPTCVSTPASIDLAMAHRPLP